jgi:hypothetical protein
VEDGVPLDLFRAQWPVVEGNDAVAQQLPPSGRDVVADGVRSDTDVTQLLPAQQPALRCGGC